MHGFFHRETTNIPVYKIHSMRTKRGLLYRMLDMKGISFDTLASKTEEIELILDDADWDALLSLVEAQENVQQQNAQQPIEKESSEKLIREEIVSDSEIQPIREADGQTLNQSQNQDQNLNQNLNSENNQVANQGLNSELRKNVNQREEQRTDNSSIQKLYFSNLNLVKGALCQNHLKGMAVLGGALLALYGNISEVGDKAIEYAVDYVETHTDQLSFSPRIFITTVIALYFVVMLLWIGKVFLRYFNMEVHINKKQLFFESGLFTRLSSQFSYDKVCTVYVKQNILEKWLKCCTLNLKQAFNATDKKDESDVKIYGSNSFSHFLNWWLGKEYASSHEILSAHSGYGVLGYTIRTDIVVTIVAMAVLAYYELYVWIIIPIFYFLVCIAKGFCAVHRSSLTLKEDYLSINTGKFADIQNYVKYSNIEVVSLVRTPFTPYFHRVNLTIATNGTAFVVRSLKEEEAKRIYELLICYCRNEH